MREMHAPTESTGVCLFVCLLMIHSGNILHIPKVPRTPFMNLMKNQKRCIHGEGHSGVLGLFVPL